VTARAGTAKKQSSSVSLIIERGPYRGVGRAEILRRIERMVDALQLKNIELSILLTDDVRVHDLNQIYRKKDRPTDVLAFAMREGELAALAGSVLGDVIVSVPTARRQAEERGAPVLEEVTMLLAHGLLHLLGWDHDTPAKDRRMRAETSRLCSAASAPVSSGRRRGGPRARARTARGASKEGADRALSRNRSRRGGRGRDRKV